MSDGITEHLSNLKDRAGASNVAKERLEPKELDINHHSISPEAGNQAIVTFKQLEASHYLYQYSPDKAKIDESFARLDKEAAKLHQIRVGYIKTEKIAFLREGFKTYLVDLLRKQSAQASSHFVEQTRHIFNSNLEKVGSGSSKHDGLISILSREIYEKIESRQVESLTNIPAKNMTKQSIADL